MASRFFLLHRQTLVCEPGRAIERCSTSGPARVMYGPAARYIKTRSHLPASRETPFLETRPREADSRDFGGSCRRFVESIEPAISGESVQSAFATETTFL